MTLEQRDGRVDRIGMEQPVVDVVNLFYAGTAEHDAYTAVAPRFADIKQNVCEYPPIIAAAMARIIKEGQTGRDIETELDKLTERTTFDTNRLNAEWTAPNAPLNPRIGIEDLEKPLFETELMPPEFSVKNQGQKQWDITTPSGNTIRVTTD